MGSILLCRGSICWLIVALWRHKASNILVSIDWVGNKPVRLIWVRTFRSSHHCVPFNCRVDIHDDVIKWKHFPRYWPFVQGIHPLTKASDAELWCFLWSAPRINGWVNNREAGDLRRYRAHYDVILMLYIDYTVLYWRQVNISYLMLTCRLDIDNRVYCFYINIVTKSGIRSRTCLWC